MIIVVIALTLLLAVVIMAYLSVLRENKKMRRSIYKLQDSIDSKERKRQEAMDYAKNYKARYEELLAEQTVEERDEAYLRQSYGLSPDSDLLP